MSFYKNTENKLLLTNSYIDHYKRDFNNICKKGKKTVTLNDIRKYLRKNGIEMTVEEISTKMYNQNEANINKEIDINEFLHIMSQINNDSEPEEENEDEEEDIINAFKFFDKRNSGKINKNELRYILTKIGNNSMSDKKCDDLFLHSELKDDNEDIDYKKLVKYWNNK